MNDIVVDHEMNDDLSKVSSFYSKKNDKFEKKVCNFILKNVHEEIEGGIKVLKEIEYDMSPYCKKEAHQAKIDFGRIEGLGNIEVTVEWTITVTKDKKTAPKQVSSNIGISNEQIKEYLEQQELLTTKKASYE